MGAPLPAELDDQIIERLAAGDTIREVARELGVPRSTVGLRHRRGPCACGRVRNHPGRCTAMVDHDEACRNLWFEVIMLAIRDADSIDRLEARKRLKKHERKHLQMAGESDPRKFFDSDWFAHICDLMHLDPAAIRDGLSARGTL